MDLVQLVGLRCPPCFAAVLVAVLVLKYAPAPHPSLCHASPVTVDMPSFALAILRNMVYRGYDIRNGGRVQVAAVRASLLLD